MKKDKDGKVLELAEQMLYYVTINSNNFLAFDICYLIECGTGDMPPEIVSFKEKVFEYVLRLDGVIEEEQEARTDFIGELKSLKSELLDVSIKVKLYEMFFDIISQMFSESTVRCMADKAKHMDMDNTSILEECFEVINELDTDEEKEIMMAKVLGCMPMKMASSKFNDYVSHSLYLLMGGSSKKLTEKAADHYKCRFAPFAAPGFGEYFPEIKDKLSESFSLDLEGFDEDGLYDHMDRLTEDMEPVDDTLNFLRCIYNVINYVINLASLVTDKDDLFEEDFLCRDLFFAALDLLKAPEESVLLNKVKELSEDRIEHYNATIPSISESIDKVLNKLSIDELSDDAAAKLVSSSMYLYNFSSELDAALAYSSPSNTEGEPASEQETKEIIDSLISFLNDAVKELPRDKKKFLKKRLMALLPWPYDFDEFVDYVSYLFESIEEYTQKIAVAYELYNLISDVPGEEEDD